jgi:hypothetical protein
LKIDTTLYGTPVKIFYWCLISIGLIGIALPIVTYYSIDDWCTQKGYEPKDVECPEGIEQNKIMHGSVGGGIIMATVGGGIGMAFLIRCSAAVKWKREKDASPCKSYRETGKHTYDLTDLKLDYSIEKGLYNTMYHTFKSKPIKCEYCDKTKEVVMSTTMEDSTY